MKIRKSAALQMVNAAVVVLLLIVSACRVTGQFMLPEVNALFDIPQAPSYMIYYGVLDEAVIERAKRYDIIIVHPSNGNITREQVAAIQSAGTLVFGYISIGEDLRTAGMTPEDMLEDERFTGNKKGPQVDPREPGTAGLDHEGYFGEASPGGLGYASYYLDDNDHDGRPDFNPNYGCAYTNIGDPNWYAELQNMSLDSEDGVAGIREILTVSYGRGLGCDGLFLDAIDTCAPNSYSDDDYAGKTRFEWTAPGVNRFLSQLKSNYPNKFIVQNRGLFFFNYQLPHFDYTTRTYIDALMFESFMLDSSASHLYTEQFFLDNRNSYAPKVAAEAERSDGFRLLSLGYAEGPEEYHLKETLMGQSDAGLDVLLKDMEEAQAAGFSHYITDASMTLANDFVLERRDAEDTEPPVWSSVHTTQWLAEPVPNVGIGEVVPIWGGVAVRWDAAIDCSGVSYTLYYQKEPFDFEADPDLEKATKRPLIPNEGYGCAYGAGKNIWPFRNLIWGLDAGETYYFVIRASDLSPARNEEKNTTVLTGAPLKLKSVFECILDALSQVTPGT